MSTQTTSSSGTGTTANVHALGTDCSVTVDRDDAAEQAETIMLRHLAAIDRAASRFREDSELMLLQRAAAGVPARVGRVLAEAVRAALWAARATAGAVDPTRRAALRAAGYDRDFDELASSSARRAGHAEVPGWEAVSLDLRAGTLTLPPRAELDLGATAKALTADRIAADVLAQTGSSALVCLGGDVATAGVGGDRSWAVGIAEDQATPSDQVAATVDMPSGGLATSSTTVRQWRMYGGRYAHHIIDPCTGEPARSPWRSVSVHAASCLHANTASTAAIVMGYDAPRWLRERGLAARLVDHYGAVHMTSGWPL